MQQTNSYQKIYLTCCNIYHNVSAASAAIIRVSHKNTACPQSRDLSAVFILRCETKKLQIKYSLFVKVSDHSGQLGVDWEIILKRTFKIGRLYKAREQVPVAARSNAQVYGRLPAEIVGSNPTGGHGCLSVVSVVCCQVEVSATD